MPGRKEIDRNLIRELAELLDETGLTEIEIEQHGLRVRIQRAPAPAAVATTVVPQPPAASAPLSAERETERERESALESHPGTVTSPMVGTCYRSPEPGAKSFVEVGDRVNEGDTLLIVEAMKTFNPITAPRAGTVTRILVDDGQPVEFGEPLIIIE